MILTGLIIFFMLDKMFYVHEQLRKSVFMLKIFKKIMLTRHFSMEI